MRETATRSARWSPRHAATTPTCSAYRVRRKATKSRTTRSARSGGAIPEEPRRRRTDGAARRTSSISTAPPARAALRSRRARCLRAQRTRSSTFAAGPAAPEFRDPRRNPRRIVPAARLSAAAATRGVPLTRDVLAGIRADQAAREFRTRLDSEATGSRRAATFCTAAAAETARARVRAAQVVRRLACRTRAATRRRRERRLRRRREHANARR